MQSISLNMQSISLNNELPRAFIQNDVALRTGFNLSELHAAGSNTTSACSAVEADKHSASFQFIEQVAAEQSFFENMAKVSILCSNCTKSVNLF